MGISLIVCLVTALIFTIVAAWLNRRGNRSAALWVRAAGTCFGIAQFIYYFGVLFTVLLVVAAIVLGAAHGYSLAKREHLEE